MAERIGPGRPPRDPYDIIDYRTRLTDTGVVREPVRVMDRIEETVAANGFIHDAAARAGIGTETLRTWRSKGVRANTDLLAGRKRRSELDTHTLRCIELAAKMERAEAEARVGLLAKITQLAQGGLEETRVTTKVAPGGDVLSRSEEVRRLLPDARALTWLLTHRYPADFAGRVEITGPQGGPVEVQVSVRDRIYNSVKAVRERIIDVDEVSGNGAKALPNGTEGP